MLEVHNQLRFPSFHGILLGGMCYEFSFFTYRPRCIGCDRLRV
jgi:hypothetical protein